jgi:hypothetical protein
MTFKIIEGLEAMIAFIKGLAGGGPKLTDQNRV